jgi:methylenetetrahydrofolate dehydrogenase (NAD+)
LHPSIPRSSDASAVQVADEPPPGTVKSIIPCTPLAIVKCLEYAGVYNTLLQYGDRAYGKTITVINRFLSTLHSGLFMNEFDRSEVVGRPLAALLSNDGARVFSVDIDSIQEYTKRPTASSSTARRYHPRHVVHPCSETLQTCLAISDVVVSAVPNPKYKVKTAWLKDGCVSVNVASEKNFEKDVREKASLYIPAVGKGTPPYLANKRGLDYFSVTIMMLLRNL